MVFNLLTIYKILNSIIP